MTKHITDLCEVAKLEMRLYLHANDRQPLRIHNYHLMMGNELQLMLLAQLSVIDDLIVQLKPKLRALKAVDTCEEWSRSLKALVKHVKVGSATTEEIVDGTNELVCGIWDSPVVHRLSEKITAEKAARKQNEQLTLSTLEQYTSFTYLFKTDKLNVFIDETASKAAFPGRETSNRDYTILQLSQAATEAANYPYFKEGPRGEMVQANVYDAWTKLGTRKVLNGITFDPSTTDRIVNGEFNVWRGWKDWGPATPGRDTVFWDEIVLRRICGGNKAYFEFVQKWLAHMVQTPWKRPLCALGIKGKQGYGKSVFVKAIGGLMDKRHYNSNVTMAHLTGQLLGRDLEGVLLAYLDEATWGGDKSLTGFVKKAITTDTDRINEKFIPAYNIPTFKRIIFTSNEGYYYHADADDRRLLPLEVPDDLGPMTNEVSQNIFNGDDYRPDFQASLLETLQNIDITDWVPHVALSKLRINTGGELIERSMENWQRFMKMSINQKSFTYTDKDGDTLAHHDSSVINIPDLQRCYASFCEQNSRDRNRQISLGEKAPKKDLVAIFGAETKVVKRAGRSVRAYKIDWKAMRKNFESTFKWEIEWDDKEEIAADMSAFECPKRSKIVSITKALSAHITI